MESDEVLFAKNAKVAKLNRWYRFAAISVAVTCTVVITLSTIGFFLLWHHISDDHSIITSTNHLATVGNQYSKAVSNAASNISSKLNVISKECVSKP